MSFNEDELKVLAGLVNEAVKGITPAPVAILADPSEEDPKDDKVSVLETQMAGMKTSIEEVLERMTNLPKIKDAGYYSDNGGTADPQNKSFGDFLLAVKRGDVKRIKEVYGSKHSSEAWEDDDVKDMSGESGPAGGYLTPSEYEPTLMEAAAPVSVIRPRATIIPVVGSAGEIPSLDQYTAPTAGQGDTAFAGGVVVTWAGEGSAGSETDPLFKMIEYKIKKMAAYTEVPNELVADSAIAIEALLTALFGRAIAAQEDFTFLRGDGVGKPLGILNAPCTIAVTTASDNVFAWADALAMLAVFIRVGGTPVWCIHPGIIPDIGVFEIGTGGGVWQANMQAALGANIAGYEIVQSEHMPAPNTDDVILMDPKGYVIFDRAGIAIAFSEHAAFTTDKGTWRVTKRLDGQPWMTSSITLADPGGSYAVSPFVYHDD